MISDASSVEDNNRTTGMKLALLAWEPRKLAKRAIVTATVINMLAAPAAAAYYPDIGMIKHESCWIARNNEHE